MKSRKFFIYSPIFLIIAIVGVFFLVNIRAQPQTEPNQTVETQPISVSPNQNTATVAQEDFLSAGQSIDVNPGGVKGDAAVAGADVRISGNVQGYVMAAGANVNVDAPVSNDLWAAGANVAVNAPVADNAMLAGSSVILAPGAAIGNDARIAASFADVKGRVMRNLNITAANAQISSEIGGDVTAYTETLTLNPGAVVRGDLIVYSPNEPVISPQAQVLGRVHFHRTEREQESLAAEIVSEIVQWFLKFLWLLILGITVILVSSVWTRRVSEMLKNQPWQSLLTGAIAVIVVPVLALLLLVSVLGLPIAFFLGAFYLIFFLLSGAFISYFVGDWTLAKINSRQDSNILKIVVGAFIVSVAVSLPFVGWLAKLAVAFFGFGAFLLERRDLFRQLREQGLA